MILKMKKSFLLSVVIVSGLTGNAQWNPDPSVNTFVAGISPVRTNCRVIAGPDGCFYVSSWQAVPDNSINFEFWLQRLDNAGNRQWGDDGTLISDGPSRTWLSGYDLAVQDNGNAVMAIEDLRSNDGFSHVALYCYGPDGQPVWNTGGIQVDTGSYASYSPVIALTTAGNIFVAWNCIYNEGQDERYAVRMKKYGPDGTALWSAAKEFAGPDSTFLYPALVSVGEDDVIMVWQRKFRIGTGVGEQWYSYIYAQRYGPDGLPLWASNIPVCDHADTAYLMPQYLEVSLAQDENDGIFMSWNDGRFDPVSSNVFVQYLSAEGILRWAQNGIAVSPVNGGHHRTLPLVACDASGEQVYLMWNERQNTSFGLCGQKISLDGSLAWGDLGRTFRGFSPDTLFFIADLDFTSAGDLLALDYLEVMHAVGLDTVTTDLACAYRINPSGDFVWSPGILGLSTSEGIKSLPQLSDPVADMYVITWVENREMPMLGFGSVYAQNFNLAGTLGPLFIPEVADHGYDMFIYPNPAKDMLFIQFNEMLSTRHVSIGIFDSRGRMAIPLFNNGSPITADVSGLTTGEYFVVVKGNGFSSCRKFLIMP